MNKIVIPFMLAVTLLTGCEAISDDHKEAAEIAIGHVAGDLVDAAKEKTGKAISKAADAALTLIETDSILNHCEVAHE